MRRSSLVILMLLGMLAMMLLGGCSQQQAPAAVTSQVGDQLVINVIDIGQGDAILIRTGAQVVLVDTGDVGARKRLSAYLKQQGIATIDKVILSHAHADHIGGMSILLNDFTIKQIYDSGVPTTTALYRNYLTTVNKKNIPFQTVKAGDRLELGNGAVFEVLAPVKPLITQEELNNNSIVGKLTHGRFSMLFTGDVEKQGEDRLRKQYGDKLKSSVLKSAHHGSKTSSTTAFLQAVMPQAVVISAGRNNDYGHPHETTLKKYRAIKAEVYRTDRDGVITITSDGVQYQIIKER